MRLIDRRGERYERLLVLERAPNRSKKDTNARWLCECDCGKRVIAYGQDLAREKIKSCGCLNAERIKKHGGARTKIYRVWMAARQRCKNPNAPAYHNYGGRGICFDSAWDIFEIFISDMGYPPKIGKWWLDRIDNDGNYCKANCKWATPVEQGRNKRTNRLVTALGETKSLAEWSELSGLPWTTIRSRIERYGWPADEAVTRPRQAGKKLRI